MRVFQLLGAGLRIWQNKTTTYVNPKENTDFVLLWCEKPAPADYATRQPFEQLPKVCKFCYVREVSREITLDYDWNLSAGLKPSWTRGHDLKSGKDKRTRLSKCYKCFRVTIVKCGVSNSG